MRWREGTTIRDGRRLPPSPPLDRSDSRMAGLRAREWTLGDPGPAPSHPTRARLRQWLCAGPCSLTVAGAALGLHQTSRFIQGHRRREAGRRWTPSATGAATYPLAPAPVNPRRGFGFSRTGANVRLKSDLREGAVARMRTSARPAEAGPTRGGGGRGLRRLRRSGGRRRSSPRWARCARACGG